MPYLLFHLLVSRTLSIAAILVTVHIEGQKALELKKFALLKISHYKEEVLNFARRIAAFIARAGS